MIKIKYISICFFLICLSGLGPRAVSADSETVTFSPRQLYKFIFGGRYTVQKVEGKEFLYLTSRVITKEQRARLERLESLGYMGGSDSYISRQNPTIAVPIRKNQISQLVIGVHLVKKGFSLSVWIENEFGESLFDRELDKAAVANLLEENANKLPIAFELKGILGPIKIYMEFKSVEAYINYISIN